MSKYLSLGWLIILPLPALASEADLRVAFVYNFIKFIEWPANTSVDAPDAVCVLGGDAEIRNAINGLKNKLNEKQQIHIIFLKDSEAVAASLTKCKIAYRPLHVEALSLPHPLPEGVVLIADEPAASDIDVSIGLVRGADDRIAFTINQTALNHAGVVASSQLLKLAKNMRGEK